MNESKGHIKKIAAFSLSFNMVIGLTHPAKYIFVDKFPLINVGKFDYLVLKMKREKQGINNKSKV